jgi:hypothetical protein
VSSTSGIAVSKYDEICEIAAAARNSWLARKQRCLQYMVTLIHGGLVTYCGVPKEQISFMRWDEDQQQYVAAGEGHNYFIPGAIEYDDEGDYWHMGVVISLPTRWVSFGLCVSEGEDGKPMVRIARAGKMRQINFADVQQCNEFYESIVALIKQALQNPRRSAKTIGFDVGSSEREPAGTT